MSLLHPSAGWHHGLDVVHVGAGLSQTQPQIQLLGIPEPTTPALRTPAPSPPAPGDEATAAAERKKATARLCEARADENGLKGSKRKSMVAKCVKLRE